MPQCVFCGHNTTMTGEHLWSAWMGELLPDKEHFFHRALSMNVEQVRWKSKMLDVKPRVVCRACNNGWMSTLESQHARPAMQPLIMSDHPVDLDSDRIRSISLFAFKTAIICNEMHSPNSPYVPRRIFSPANRRAFARSFALPAGIQVWIGCLAESTFRNGIMSTRYSKTPFGTRNGCKFYVCTLGLGRFILQLSAGEFTGSKKRRVLGFPFLSDPGWESMTTLIWPHTGSAKWPPARQIPENLVEAFCLRWEGRFTPQIP